MTSRRTGAVEEVAAGGEHTLVRTRSGAVLSAGACGLGWCRGRGPVSPALHAWRRVVGLPEPVARIHAGYYHNVVLGQNTGRLYSWGCGTFVDGNNDGVIPALGPPPSSSSVRAGQGRPDTGGRPVPIDLPDGVRAVGVSGGAYHSIFLTDRGSVLTCGAAQLGQLGRSLDASASASTDGAGLPVDPVPRPVEGIGADERVARVGAGFYNTLAACMSGRLYCSGENQNRQCGMAAGRRNIHRMVSVDELAGRHVVAAEGGYCHTLVLDSRGEVATMGCGDEGQRGDGLSEDHYETEAGGSDGGGGSRPVVSLVALPCRATAVAAGANHSVVLGEGGEVFAFGSNEYGQCGQDQPDDEEEDTHVLAPVRVRLPEGAGRAVDVSAGYAHTAVRDEHGRVYTFGQNENGQLGLGEVRGPGVDSLAARTRVLG